MYLLPRNLNQKGFAIIPLLILVVVGIGAGVLLVQNRTNFLPKAETSVIKECNISNANTVQGCRSFGGLTTNQLYCGVAFSHCDFPDPDGRGSIVTSTNFEQCKTFSPNKMFCTISESIPGCKLEGVTIIGSGPGTKSDGSLDELTYGQIADVCDANKKSFEYTCDGFNRLKPKAMPSEDSKCTTVAAAQPPAANSQAPGIASTQCSDTQKKQCQDESWQPKGGCVITTTGLRQCKYEPSREGDKCNNDPTHPETGAVCGSTECRVIDGLPRCITSASSCPIGEPEYCKKFNATCEIGTKKIGGVDKNYTYCKPGSSAVAPAAAPANQAPRPASGSQNAPAITSPKSCVDNTYYDAQKQPIYCDQRGQICSTYTPPCTSPSVAASCTDNSALKFFRDNGFVYNAELKKCVPPASIITKNGTCAGEGSSVCKKDGKACADLFCDSQNKVSCYACTKTATPTDTNSPIVRPGQIGATECGYTMVGGTEVPIPCFRVGVFASPDELQSTKANARIAVARYNETKTVLEEILKSEKASASAKEAATRAQKKLEDAQTAAQACIDQK